jgi:hypothetical protein
LSLLGPLASKIPGVRNARFEKLRSDTARSSIWRVVIVEPRALFVVSTIGASPSTVTVSATGLTLSAKSTLACWPMRSVIPERTSELNPVRVAFIS